MYSSPASHPALYALPCKLEVPIPNNEVAVRRSVIGQLGVLRELQNDDYASCVERFHKSALFIFRP